MSKGKRQTVRTDPAVAAYLSGEEPPEELQPTRKRPRYPSEDKRSKATYNLDAETIERVREIARLERFGKKQISVVAEALLNFAIEAYEAGEIHLVVTPDPDTWKAEVVRGDSDTD